MSGFSYEVVNKVIFNPSVFILKFERRMRSPGPYKYNSSHPKDT